MPEDVQDQQHATKHCCLCYLSDIIGCGNLRNQQDLKKKSGFKTSFSDTHKSNFKNKNSTTWENNQIKDYYFENKNKTEQSKSLLGREKQESRHEPQMAHSAQQNLTKSLFPNWFKYCLRLTIKWTLNTPVRQSICPIHYTICGCVKSERTFGYF